MLQVKRGNEPFYSPYNVLTNTEDKKLILIDTEVVIDASLAGTMYTIYTFFFLF